VKNLVARVRGFLFSFFPFSFFSLFHRRPFSRRKDALPLPTAGRFAALHIRDSVTVKTGRHELCSYAVGKETS